MTAILLGLAVAVIVIYAGILIAAFSGEDETSEPEQDKEIKFEDLEEGQCYWLLSRGILYLEQKSGDGCFSIGTEIWERHNPDSKSKIVALCNPPKHLQHFEIEKNV